MNVALNLNWETGELVKLQFGNIMEVATEKFSRGFRSQQVERSLNLTHFVPVVLIAFRTGASKCLSETDTVM